MSQHLSFFIFLLLFIFLSFSVVMFVLSLPDHILRVFNCALYSLTTQSLKYSKEKTSNGLKESGDLSGVKVFYILNRNIPLTIVAS